MAQLKQNNIAKVPAFTLFESVVAITVIAVLIGLGTMVYSNLMQAENPLAYYMAKNEVDRRFEQLSHEKFLLSGFSENYQVEAEAYQIEEKIDPYKNDKRIYQVTYIATSGGKELFREHHLIPRLNEE